MELLKLNLDNAIKISHIWKKTSINLNDSPWGDSHHAVPCTLLMFRWIGQNIWCSAIFLETNDFCYLVVGQVGESGYIVLNVVGTLHQLIFKPLYLWLEKLSPKEMKVLFNYFFIYLWLCWVFVSVRGLSLVAANGGHSSSRCAGLSLSRPLLLRSTGSRHAGSVIVAHGPSCSAACGTFLDQGSNPHPLH